MYDKIFKRVAFMLVACLSSCDFTSPAQRRLVAEHDLIVARAVAEVPLFAEFNRGFPGSRHFISYITGREATPTWNSTSDVFDRYELSMAVEVDVNRNSPHNVTLKGDPKFYLNEVTSVDPLPDGRKMISYGKQYNFTILEWNRWAARNFDFSELGFDLRKNDPVPGFKERLEGAKRP